MVGRELSHYKILERLGAGGMGEVFLAEDTALKRRVALKILPKEVAGNRERLTRFEREAEALAAIDHPNILTIHSVEEAEGVHFLTMELVEGKPLSDLIPRGGMTLDQIFAISISIADGLAAAHAKGIVHRDLKPANVMVTDREQRVKILDFGLAKLRRDAQSTDPSQDDTELLTSEGRLLGTAAYASPEQAEGRQVDHRSDIFSFGVLLYEMAVGTRPFQGETRAALLSSILRDTPVPVTEIRHTLPNHLGRISAACLEKDPVRRLQSAFDLKLALESLKKEVEVSGSFKTLAPRFGRPKAWKRFAWGGLAVVLLSAAVSSIWYVTRQPAPPHPVRRWVVRLPDNSSLGTGFGHKFALSSDGSRLVYSAETDGERQLVFRLMDSLDASPIPGTEGGANPFFSPDGRWIGFFAGGDLKKVPLEGGDPVQLYRTNLLHHGAVWGRDGWIYVSLGFALWRLPEGGGTPAVIAEPPPSQEVRAYFWPTLSTDGASLLFTIWRGSADTSSVALLDLTTNQHRVLVERGTNPMLAHSGHLLFSRGGSLHAAPFDRRTREITEPTQRVVEGVWTESYGAAQVAVAEDGSMVYVPGVSRPVENALVWVARDGQSRPLSEERRRFRTPRLSPDGRRVAVRISDERGTDIWILDLERDAFSRLTFEGSNVSPVWSPDGAWIVFASDRQGDFDIYRKRADLSGEPQLLLAREHKQYPESISPDGEALLFTELRPEGVTTWMLPLRQGQPFRPLPESRFSEAPAVFSPDGKWVAYVSNASGQDEVYVQSLADPARRGLVSREGGTQPVWAKQSRRLFYLSGQTIMVVRLEGESLPGPPDEFLHLEGRHQMGAGAASYDVATDDERFLMVLEGHEPTPGLLHVVLNWTETLERGAQAH